MERSKVLEAFNWGDGRGEQLIGPDQLLTYVRQEFLRGYLTAMTHLLDVGVDESNVHALVKDVFDCIKREVGQSFYKQSEQLRVDLERRMWGGGFN